MNSPLDHLLEEGIISEVVGRLQSGKEAEVFLVRYGERIVAAKVYKDRSQRSFKNNSAYKEGRGVRNTRDQRAMERRSRFGKGAEEDAWKSAEADALYRLHAAEVRVPTPLLFFEGVLLMDLVVDAEGVTARRLIDTELSAEQAHAAYHDMLSQLVRMLACDLIHGDLSPYNVLWGASGATIIDFPQIVSAAQNSNSERFFMRDAENILGYFRASSPRLAARRGDAAEIWRAYMCRELSADFVPTGKGRPPPPQRPLPIGAPRSANGGSMPRQPSGAASNALPSQRGYGSPRGAQQPSRSASPQQQRPGGQGRQGGRPGPRGPQQRGSAQHRRGSEPSQQPRQPGQPARRAMPEVIVRPRSAAAAPPRPPSTSEGAGPNAPLDSERNRAAKRR
jgi:RIO kinase 1